MLYTLGRSSQGRSAPGSITSSSSVMAKIFDFSAGVLPAEFTYTRADSVATLRNNAGKLIASSVNTPRFDHDELGTALGMRIEPPSTNKNLNYNINPTNTFGLTKGGDALSVLSVADDPGGLLVGAGLDLLCTNGKLFFLDNSAGSSNSYVDIGGEVGNINPHSFSVYIAGVASGYSGNCTFVGSSTTVAITSASLTRLLLENQTPTHSTRKVRINVSAGKGVYFILNQLEEMPFSTSPIITAGTASTRQREVCVATGIDSTNWFNEHSGAMVGEYVFDRPTGFDEQYAFLASEGTGFDNAMGIYLVASEASQIRARDIATGVNQQNDDVHRPIAGRRMPVALSWTTSKSYALAGPVRFNEVLRGDQASGLTNLYVGGRPFNGAMSGWVKKLSVYNQFRTVEQLGADMIPNSGVRAVISGGQSNKHGFFRSTAELLNSGEEKAIEQMDDYWGATENWLINGAQNGSFAIKQNDPNLGTAEENWWYDPVADEFGPRMAYWEAVANGFGVDKIEAIDWDQGESDSASSLTELKAAWLAVFVKMRSVVGAKPVIISPIGRRSDFQSSAYNVLRLAQQELAEENSWIYLAPEKFIHALSDTAHMTNEGYGAHAEILMRKVMDVLGETVSGGVDGPEMVSAVRSGTSVTVSLSHNAGGDFTPSMGIAGFKFFDDLTEVVISSAVRTNATTITLTLAAVPSGAETLYYGYGTMLEEASTYTSLVRDTSSYQLPLRRAVVSVL